MQTKMIWRKDKIRENTLKTFEVWKSSRIYLIPTISIETDKCFGIYVFILWFEFSFRKFKNIQCGSNCQGKGK